MISKLGNCGLRMFLANQNETMASYLKHNFLALNGMASCGLTNQVCFQISRICKWKSKIKKGGEFSHSLLLVKLWFAELHIIVESNHFTQEKNIFCDINSSKQGTSKWSWKNWSVDHDKVITTVLPKGKCVIWRQTMWKQTGTSSSALELQPTYNTHCKSTQR